MRRRFAFQVPALWIFSLGLGLTLGLLNSGSEVIDVLTGDRDAALWEPFSWELTSTLTTGVLVPFVATFALHFRFARFRPLPVIAAHLAAAPVFSAAHVGIMVAARKVIYLVQGRRYEFGQPGLEFLYELLKDVITYALIIGLTYGFDYYRRFRERELAASRLETSLARAHLENLEHRIQPHFLFNALNMISAKMHEDVDAADRMVARLSDLLRMSMRRQGRQEVSLAEELELLDAYLEIMRARFEERLRVLVDVPPGMADARVPPLLLQPLVENAIKHGIAHRESGGRVEVRIRRNGRRLSIEVNDDGPGAGATPAGLLGKGLGLSTTAERLERIYGDGQELHLEDSPTGGLAVRITIPFRTGPDAPEGDR